MAIPRRLEIDFSKDEKDLISQGLEKMLSVFFDACTLRQFVGVLLTQVQELYDEAIKVKKGRTLYNAEGVNLDALGRIVGQSRALWEYSESGFMHFDSEGESFDQEIFWCFRAPLGEYAKAPDSAYAQAILSRIVKNHTLVAAVPELLGLIDLMLNTPISFNKVGPNTVQLIFPWDISVSAIKILTSSTTDTRVDDTYQVPYPVTLSFDELIMFIPPQPFHFDRDSPYCFDDARWGVGVPFIQ